MIYLDTHVVVWLYAGLVEKLNEPLRNLLNEHEINISPTVHLELQYLFEIGRVNEESAVIVADLSNRIGLQVCDKAFKAVVSEALTFSWTRDPFDRLIVAHASLDDNLLVSKDQRILQHYPHARW